MLKAEECIEPLVDCGFLHHSTSRTLTYLVLEEVQSSTRRSIAGVYVQSGSNNAPGTIHNAVVFDSNLFSAIKSAEYAVNQHLRGTDFVAVNNQPIRGKSFSRHRQSSGDTVSIGVGFKNAMAIKSFMHELMNERDTFGLRGEFRDPLKGSSVEPLLTDKICIESVIKLITTQLDKVMGLEKHLLSDVFLSPRFELFAISKVTLSLIAQALTIDRDSTLTLDEFKLALTRLLALYCISSELLSEDHLITFDYDNNAYWSKTLSLFRSLILLFVARYDSFDGLRNILRLELDFDEISKLRTKMDIPNSGHLNVIQLGLLCDRKQSSTKGLLYKGISGERLIDLLIKIPSHSKTGKYLSVAQWDGFSHEIMQENASGDAYRIWLAEEQYLSLGRYISTD